MRPIGKLLDNLDPKGVGGVIDSEQVRMSLKGMESLVFSQSSTHPAG
jgi:hypothetical protein